MRFAAAGFAPRASTCTAKSLARSHPFLGLDNVVLSPHVAYNTPEAAIALHDIAVECLVRYFEGDPINVVAGPA